MTIKHLKEIFSNPRKALFILEHGFGESKIYWILCQWHCTSIKKKPTVWRLEEDRDLVHQYYLTYGEYLMKEALAEVKDFKIGGRIINKVIFMDDMAIYVKIQEELQGMLKRLVDTGRKYNMEINIVNHK